MHSLTNGALARPPPTAPGAPRFGTVGWLFREYKASENYRLRVSARTRPDYDRTMRLVADFQPKKGARIGARPVRSITPRAADKLVKLLATGKRGPRPRQVEKVRAVCRHAWTVVHRLYPDVFDAGIPNPWVGVTLPTRTHATKAAVDREAVYSFAWKAIEAGHPEPAAAAVIAFEWLQRPENIIGGHVTWPGYRGAAAPDQIRILHPKTGAVVLHRCPIRPRASCSMPMLMPRPCLRACHVAASRWSCGRTASSTASIAWAKLSANWPIASACQASQSTLAVTAA